MAKGTRYTPEFKAKAVRLLTESRGSYSSETKAIEQVAKDLGVAPETLRRWRNKTDATVAGQPENWQEYAEQMHADIARFCEHELRTNARIVSIQSTPKIC